MIEPEHGTHIAKVTASDGKSLHSARIETGHPGADSIAQAIGEAIIPIAQVVYKQADASIEYATAIDAAFSNLEVVELAFEEKQENN